MGISPADAPIFIHRIRAGREQATACREFTRVPRHMSLPQDWQLPLHGQGPGQARQSCNEKGGQVGAPRTVRVQHQEIEFFREKLHPESNIIWETPIAHIIPRMPTFTAFGDSCLEGAGGYSIPLGYWWHIPFPEEVKRRTLIHKKDNSDGLLISINVLEFVTVIVNYCAALHVITTTPATNDPHPVLLNVTDNASALSWTTGACRRSMIGRRLARFFCSLLIGSPLGINSKWISTDDNKIADDISRMKSQTALDSHPSFDYSTLKQRYPELTHCRSFQMQPELISLIWEIVLTERWHCHDEIRKLRLKPLGRLTTSDGAKS